MTDSFDHEHEVPLKSPWEPAPVAYHANIVRQALRRARWSDMGMEDNEPERRDALAALDALQAKADCGGINCGKCQQCLTVHEFFLKKACEQHKAELATLHESRARDIQLHTEHLTSAIWAIKDAAVTHGVNDKVGEAIAHAVMVTRNNT